MARIGRLRRHSVEDPIRDFLLIFEVEVNFDGEMLVVFGGEQLIPEIDDADFLAENGARKPIDGVCPVIGSIRLVDFYRLPLFRIVKRYAFTKAYAHRHFLLEDVYVEVSVICAMEQVEVELRLGFEGYVLHQQRSLFYLAHLQIEVLFLVEDYGVSQEAAILRPQEIQLRVLVVKLKVPLIIEFFFALLQTVSFLDVTQINDLASRHRIINILVENCTGGRLDTGLQNWFRRYEGAQSLTSTRQSQDAFQRQHSQKNFLE